MLVSLSEVRHAMQQDGFCVLPAVLTEKGLRNAREALDLAVSETARRGIPLFDGRIDPNAQNVRVNNLPDLSPVFVELLRHPDLLPIVQDLLGRDAFVSNFTANIALPGSKSMRLHSDQALAVPAPWIDQWAMNMIWCLDDVHEANGATRYVAGSHRYRTFEDVPSNASENTLAFCASAGSVIVMDGRLWHTSGANVTRDERRALLFAYYARGFIRPQVNWEVCLSQETKARLDDGARELLGMGPVCNITGLPLVALQR